MQTTLDIDDDVLIAIKELANRQGTTAGRIISELLRQSLQASTDTRERATLRRETMRNGFELLPAGGEPVSAELVQNLLDDEL